MLLISSNAFLNLSLMLIKISFNIIYENSSKGNDKEITVNSMFCILTLKPLHVFFVMLSFGHEIKLIKLLTTY
jgi:hypothetical protein